MLDLLLPQRCVVCGARGVQLCDACVAGFARIAPPLCERCGNPTAWPVRRCRECAGRRLAFATARAAIYYDDTARPLVAAWKERGLRRLAEAAVLLVVEVVPPTAGRLITFVPPDPDRGLRRGHHPPERLARALGRHWDLPVAGLLCRRSAGKRQRGLSRVERRRNVAGAFVSKPAPATVVLVDDVFTSGATANAASSALRKGGARRVEIVTFARVVR